MILVKQKSLKKNASDMQSSSSVDDVTSCCSKSSSDHNASSSRWGKVQTNILDRRNARVVSRGNQVAPAPVGLPVTYISSYCLFVCLFCLFLLLFFYLYNYFIVIVIPNKLQS